MSKLSNYSRSVEEEEKLKQLHNSSFQSTKNNLEKLPYDSRPKGTPKSKCYHFSRKLNDKMTTVDQHKLPYSHTYNKLKEQRFHKKKPTIDEH